MTSSLTRSLTDLTLSVRILSVTGSATNSTGISAETAICGVAVETFCMIGDAAASIIDSTGG